MFNQDFKFIFSIFLWRQLCFCVQSFSWATKHFVIVMDLYISWYGWFCFFVCLANSVRVGVEPNKLSRLPKINMHSSAVIFVKLGFINLQKNASTVCSNLYLFLLSIFLIKILGDQFWSSFFKCGVDIHCCSSTNMQIESRRYVMGTSVVCYSEIVSSLKELSSSSVPSSKSPAIGAVQLSWYPCRLGIVAMMLSEIYSPSPSHTPHLERVLPTRLRLNICRVLYQNSVTLVICWSSCIQSNKLVCIIQYPKAVGCFLSPSILVAVLVQLCIVWGSCSSIVLDPTFFPKRVVPVL